MTDISIKNKINSCKSINEVKSAIEFYFDDLGKDVDPAVLEFAAVRKSELANNERIRINGRSINYDIAAASMDNHLAWVLAEQLPPCHLQEFIEAYQAAHAKRFDKPFFVLLP